MDNLDDLEKFWISNGMSDKEKFLIREPRETDIRLRFDYELTGESYNDENIKAGIEILRSDLEDLAINGDTKSTDPLYTSMDGAKILNKKLKSFEVNQATVYFGYNWGKDTTEYTVFLSVEYAFE